MKLQIDLLFLRLCGCGNFNDNIKVGNKWILFYNVKQSDSPSTLDTYWGEPDQTDTDNITKYYDMSKNVVDVLGGAVSTIYRRLSESRNHRNVITSIIAGSSCHRGGSLKVLFRG